MQIKVCVVAGIAIWYFSFIISQNNKVTLNCDEKKLFPLQQSSNPKLLRKLNVAIKKLASENVKKREIAFLQIRKLAPRYLKYLQKRVPRLGNIYQKNYLKGYLVEKLQNITDAGLICNLSNNRFMWYVVIDKHILIIGNQEKVVDSFATPAFIDRIYDGACDGSSKKLKNYVLYFTITKPFYHRVILTNDTFFKAETTTLYKGKKNEWFLIVETYADKKVVYYNGIKIGVYKEVNTYYARTGYEKYSWDTSGAENELSFIARTNNDKYVFIYKGKVSKEYKRIDGIRISMNKEKILFVGQKDNGKKVVVINWKESKEYEDIMITITSPLLSYNGKKFAFIAKKSNGRWVVVVNDKKISKEYERITLLRFSPDSKRLAFIAQKANNNMILGINGKEKWEYNEIQDSYPCQPTFSPDSKKIAFCATKNTGKTVFVLNGAESKEYDRVTDIIFSPDSKRYAFKAHNKGGVSPVIDGNEDIFYMDVYGFTFSNDSKKYSYIVRDKLAKENSDVYHIVVNGVMFKPYKLIWDFIFSPDSQHFAFCALTEKNKRIIVLDGIESDEYFSVSALTFSPDGKRFAFWAIKKGGGQLIVLDGKESNEYSYINSTNNMFFNAHTNTLIFHATNSTGEFVLNIDNIEIDKYSFFTFAGDIANSDKLTYFGCKDNKQCSFYSCTIQKEVAEK